MFSYVFKYQCELAHSYLSTLNMDLLVGLPGGGTVVGGGG